MTGSGENIRREPGSGEDRPETKIDDRAASASAGPARETDGQRDGVTTALDRLRHAATAHVEDVSLA
jgi:hypothetical protein